MKFDYLLEKACPGYGFFLMLPHTEYCCADIEMHTITAMLLLSKNKYPVFYMGIDDDRPCLKIRDVNFCPFCGERFGLAEHNSHEIERTNNSGTLMGGF